MADVPKRLAALLPPVAVVAVLSATVACYAPALRGAFTFDDETSILLNERVRSVEAWLGGLTLEEALAGRPVTELTFALDAERSRLGSVAFHETSLALHLAAVLAVLALTRAVLRRAGIASPWPSVLVAAAFALHPIQSEAVAYVAQRSEVLASLLGLVTLHLLLSADRATTSRRAFVLGAASLLVHAAAVGAKLVATVVPVLFLLACLWFPAPSPRDAAPDGGEPRAGPPRSRWPRRAALVAPLLALSAVQVAVFLGSIRGKSDVGFSVPGLDPWRYLLTQARVVPFYLRLLLWPSGQNVDHDVAPSAGLLDPPTTLAGLLLLALLAAGAVAGLLWARRPGRDPLASARVRLASFGIAWFLVVLAPTSTIVPLADVEVEHRLYLAGWGVLVAVAALAAARVRDPLRARVLCALAVFVPVALGIALHARASLWGDPIALWRDAAEKSPRRARPHLNIGYGLQKRGDLEGAIESYRRALALGVGGEETRLLQNVATALLALRRPGEARAVLASVTNPDPLTAVLLALAAIDLGDLAEAERYAWDLVLRAPSFHRSHEVMGKLLQARGDLVRARDSFRRAAELAPGAGTLHQLGLAELQLGDRAAACRTLARASSAMDDAWVARWAAADAARAGCR